MANEDSEELRFPKIASASALLAKLICPTAEEAVLLYLKEIVERLVRLEELTAETVNEGFLEQAKLGITDSPTKFSFNARHFSLRNDGTNEMYMMQFEGNPLSKDTYIDKNEQVNFDFGTKRRRTFWLVCNEDETATVRIFTW